MIGKVLWFDVKKGYGFIRANNQDIFVHFSKILAPAGEFRVLEQNEMVEFELFHAQRGDGSEKPQARNVKRLEGAQNEILREKPDHSVGRHNKSTKTDKTE